MDEIQTLKTEIIEMEDLNIDKDDEKIQKSVSVETKGQYS